MSLKTDNTLKLADYNYKTLQRYNTAVLNKLIKTYMPDYNGPYLTRMQAVDKILQYKEHLKNTNALLPSPQVVPENVEKTLL